MMSTPNTESLKRVFCTMATNRNKVSIPCRVSKSTVSKERLNSIEEWVPNYYQSRSDGKTFGRAYTTGRSKDALGTMPYDWDKHPWGFYSPVMYVGARMIGGGRGYLGRHFTVVREAETGGREKPGLIEFENGEQELYLKENGDLIEGKRYRLDGGRRDTLPPAIPFIKMTETSEGRNDD